jgi:hypothetical protein
LAVLNKIDILWDDLKSEAEVQAMIQSQVDATARQLSLPPEDVFAISDQKALVARIRNDAELLMRSGIERLEEVLSKDVVATKHKILSDTVINETANMVKASRKTMQQRLAAIRSQQAELDSLRGKNRDVVQSLLTSVSADRKLYDESVRTFNEANQRIMKQGEALMQQLSLTQLDKLLEKSREEIGDSWTTRGLNRGMKRLIQETTKLAEKISQQSLELVDAGESLYLLFHTQHGFEQQKPPHLDMSTFHQSMMALEQHADEFCADPLNVMTEKHFLVRKFFYTLVTQVRAQFEKARNNAGVWLKGLLAPLKLQIGDHKMQLDRRTESLMKVHENMASLQKNIDEVELQASALQRQSAALDQILLTLMKSAQKRPVMRLAVPETDGGSTPSVEPLAT